MSKRDCSSQCPSEDSNRAARCVTAAMWRGVDMTAKERLGAQDFTPSRDPRLRRFDTYTHAERVEEVLVRRTAGERCAATVV